VAGTSGAATRRRSAPGGVGAAPEATHDEDHGQGDRGEDGDHGTGDLAGVEGARGRDERHLLAELRAPFGAPVGLERGVGVDLAGQAGLHPEREDAVEDLSELLLELLRVDPDRAAAEAGAQLLVAEGLDAGAEVDRAREVRLRREEAAAAGEAEVGERAVLAADLLDDGGRVGGRPERLRRPDPRAAVTLLTGSDDRPARVAEVVDLQVLVEVGDAAGGVGVEPDGDPDRSAAVPVGVDTDSGRELAAAEDRDGGGRQERRRATSCER
jgi:hypothetical protein